MAEKGDRRFRAEVSSQDAFKLGEPRTRFEDALATKSAEFIESVAAFRGKRRARFVGR
jgi:hypothetical protein